MARIQIIGEEGLGWSLDRDAAAMVAIAHELGHEIVKHSWNADIVHHVGWSSLASWRRRPIVARRLLATASNFVDLDREDYEMATDFAKIRNRVNAWLVPSTHQKDIFDRHRITAFLNPFPLDLDIFHPCTQLFDRPDRIDGLHKQFGLPPEPLQGRVIIGSFQRDSLANNLSQPKWQKGPELLAELLAELPKERFILLLAGPRRHYLRKRCRELNIPFLFIGREVPEDDIKINNLTLQDISKLYSLIDLYLVTSRSEGGPKAVQEAIAMKCPILSTDVGFARDFLEAHNICMTKNDYATRLTQVMDALSVNPTALHEEMDRQYDKLQSQMSWHATLNRIHEAYEYLLTQQSFEIPR